MGGGTGKLVDWYGIPRERIIDSTVAYRYVEDEHGGAIVQRADLDVINDGPDKAVQMSISACSINRPEPDPCSASALRLDSPVCDNARAVHSIVAGSKGVP